jgi:hypothetical protein
MTFAYKRSTFLFWTLCGIFVWVLVFDFYNTIYSYNHADEILIRKKNELTQLQSIHSKEDLINSKIETIHSYERLKSNANLILLSSIACCLISVLGLVLLFFLKKIGFFFFSIGELSYTVSFFILVNFNSGSFNLLNTVEEFMIPIFLIIVVSTQLKHMD